MKYTKKRASGKCLCSHVYENDPVLFPPAAAQSCGGNLQGPNGTFTSPNWPSNYPNNALCQWTIKVASGNTITLDFVDFELERASPVYGCAGRDFVAIVDGDDSYGP